MLRLAGDGKMFMDFPLITKLFKKYKGTAWGWLAILLQHTTIEY